MVGCHPEVDKTILVAAEPLLLLCTNQQICTTVLTTPVCFAPGVLPYLIYKLWVLLVPVEYCTAPKFCSMPVFAWVAEDRRGCGFAGGRNHNTHTPLIHLSNTSLRSRLFDAQDRDNQEEDGDVSQHLGHINPWSKWSSWSFWSPIRVECSGWKWAGDVLGEKLGNGRRWFYTPARYPTNTFSPFTRFSPTIQTSFFHPDTTDRRCSSHQPNVLKTNLFPFTS